MAHTTEPGLVPLVPQQKQTVWVDEGTLYCELGLRFYGGIRVVRHAGVDAGILLCEIGDLETASSQDLHTTLAAPEGNREAGEEISWI